MTRKHWIAAVAVALIMALVSFTAALADDPVKVTMDLSANQFTGPKTIDIKISVANTGDTEMPGPLTLYYPSGKQVEEFGSPTLGVGESRDWSGTWTVTEDELQSGKITFKIKYSIHNENGELVNKTKNFSKKISYAGSEPQLSIERVVKPSVASNGQQVSVTYQFVNNGAVDVTGITIKENSSISSKSGTIESIPAGQKDSYTFTVTMGKKDLTSSAVITYKAGGKTYTEKKDAEVIKNGVVPLTATLTADKKGGAPGDTLHLTLKIKNTGKADFSNVTVTDENLGTVFSGESVPAGTTTTLEKDVTMNETADIQFSVTGETSDGQKVDTATGPVHWTVLDPSKQAVLSVKAEADREAVFEIPGTVRFTVTVKNEGPTEVKNISVKAVGTTLYTFASIPSGEEKSFTRDMSISMPGQFRFDAVCKDELGQPQTFSSNVLPIRLADKTPEPTSTPIITPEPPRYEDIPTDDAEVLPGWMKTVQKIADSLKWVLLGLTVALVALLAVAVLKRILAKARSAAAMDHLEGSNHRNYSVAPKRGNRNEIRDSEDENKAAENKEKEKENNEETAQDSDLVAETLRRLYTDDNKHSVEADAEVPAANEEPDTPAAAETPEGALSENEVKMDAPEEPRETDGAGSLPEKDEKAVSSDDEDLSQRITREIQSAAIYRHTKRRRESLPEQLEDDDGLDGKKAVSESGAAAKEDGSTESKAKAAVTARKKTMHKMEQLGMNIQNDSGAKDISKE